MGMDVDAKMIWAWARTLVTETDTIPADVVVILGLSGTLVRTGTKLDVQPPPPGAKKATIHLAGEAFDALEVEVASAVTTAELEKHLGPSRILGAGRIGFRLAEPEAPHACEVTVTVDGGQVRRVSMKRATA